MPTKEWSICETRLITVIMQKWRGVTVYPRLRSKSIRRLSKKKKKMKLESSNLIMNFTYKTEFNRFQTLCCYNLLLLNLRWNILTVEFNEFNLLIVINKPEGFYWQPNWKNKNIRVWLTTHERDRYEMEMERSLSKWNI